MSIQTKALKELAEIRTGYSFRGAAERVSEGGCLLVQAGNIDGEAGDLTGEPARIATPPNFAEHALHYAEVLLIARGPRNDAATYTWDTGGALAASHLMILRPARRISFPDYLTWFLNLPATQAKIRAMRSESTVPFVSVEALGRLRVPVPSDEVQNAIAEIQKLSTQEQRLMEQIRRQRRVLVDGLLMEAVRLERPTQGLEGEP